MSKNRFHTIEISIPHEMLNVTKAGKVILTPSLTKSGNITKRNGKQAFKVIPSNDNEAHIISNGNVTTKEELKKKKILLKNFNNHDKLIASINKMKPINNKLYLGEFRDPDFKPFVIKGPIKRYSNSQNSSTYKNVFNGYVTYFFKNIYKHLPKQEIPTEKQLAKVAYPMYILRDSSGIKSYYSNGNAKSASYFFFEELKCLTAEKLKIINMIAYNDGINGNRKLFNKACKIYTDDVKRASEEAEESNRKQRAIYDAQTPEQKKAFEKRMHDSYILEDPFPRKIKQQPAIITPVEIVQDVNKVIAQQSISNNNKILIDNVLLDINATMKLLYSNRKENRAKNSEKLDKIINAIIAYDFYPTPLQYGEYIYKSIINNFNSLKDVHILDICCGLLSLSLPFIENMTETTSIDLIDQNPTFCEIIKPLDKLKNIDIRQADFFELPPKFYYNSNIDVILCNPPFAFPINGKRYENGYLFFFKKILDIMIHQKRGNQCQCFFICPIRYFSKGNKKLSVGVEI